MSRITFSREDLYQLITKRIGIETYTDKLASISKLEAYSQSALKPQLKCRKPADLCFDYEFCRLYKSLESKIHRHLESQSNADLQNGGVGPDISVSLSNMSAFEDRILEQYKGLIRDQDGRIKQLTDQYAHLQGQYNQMCAEFYELQSSVQQLRDQNALLKAQKSASTHSLPGAISSSSSSFYSGNAQPPTQESSSNLPLNSEAASSYQYGGAGYYPYSSSQPSDLHQASNATYPYTSPMSAVSIPIPVDASEEMIRAKDAEINELRSQLDALRLSAGYQQQAHPSVAHGTPIYSGYGGDTMVELERLRSENTTLRETLETLESEIKSLEENKNFSTNETSCPTSVSVAPPVPTSPHSNDPDCGVNEQQQPNLSQHLTSAHENIVENHTEIEQVIYILRQENEYLKSERQTLLQTINAQESKLRYMQQKLFQHGIPVRSA